MLCIKNTSFLSVDIALSVLSEALLSSPLCSEQSRGFQIIPEFQWSSSVILTRKKILLCVLSSFPHSSVYLPITSLSHSAVSSFCESWDCFELFLVSLTHSDLNLLLHVTGCGCGSCVSVIGWLSSCKSFSWYLWILSWNQGAFDED